MICLTLILTLCLVGMASCDSRRGKLDRDLLKNFKEFRSDRSSSTSTSSSDSSSDASRIAKAVEAALREAELSDKYNQKKGMRGGEMDGGMQRNSFETFRLRLSTIAQSNTCGFFDCTDFDDVSSAAQIEGAQVTVVTSDGTFTAEFDASGAAVNENDMFAFTVQYTPQAGEDLFTLSTIAGEFGVNVTSVEIATQSTSALNAVVFDTAVNNEFWDEQTLLNSDETLQVANSTAIVGCDQTFDCVENGGSTSYTVTLGPNAETEFLVANITGNLTLSWSAGVRALNTAASELNQLAAEAGLGNLPCTQRASNVYLGTAIATKAGSGNSLDHPTLYQALVNSQGAAGLSTFAAELQQVAGRKQVRVRDLVLDNGAFSPLSHKSKFTACFRVFPEDAGGSIETFIGIDGGQGLVRASLPVTELLDEDDEMIEFDEDDVPEFDVTEVALFDLLQANDATNTRPFVNLPSDVTVTIERCPEFTYYQ